MPPLNPPESIVLSDQNPAIGTGRVHPVHFSRFIFPGSSGLENNVSMISCIVVKESDVSLNHKEPIEGHPETPGTSQHYHIEGIMGVPDSVRHKKTHGAQTGCPRSGDDVLTSVLSINFESRE